MNGYLLDTSVIISYTKGDAKIINLIDGLDGPTTSSFICLAELYEGILRSTKSAEIEDVILAFFEGLAEVYSLDKEIVRKFGETRANLKKRGAVIEDFDILIAATCLVNDLTLVTLNIKHFSRIRGLQLYTAG